MPDTILRWQREKWSDGDPADGPAPLSAFDVVDALLAKLGDRAMFPNLSQVVLALLAFAGGQLVQRYAIVGRGELALGQAGYACAMLSAARRAMPISLMNGHCPTAG